MTLLNITCNCGQPLTLAAGQAGPQGQCPHCGQKFPILSERQQAQGGVVNEQVKYPLLFWLLSPLLFLLAAYGAYHATAVGPAPVQQGQQPGGLLEERFLASLPSSSLVTPTALARKTVAPPSIPRERIQIQSGPFPANSRQAIAPAGASPARSAQAAPQPVSGQPAPPVVLPAHQATLQFKHPERLYQLPKVELRLKNGTSYHGRLRALKAQELVLQQDHKRITIPLDALTPQTLIILKKKEMDPANAAAHFQLGCFALQAQLPLVAQEEFQQALTLNAALRKPYQQYQSLLKQALQNSPARQLIRQGDQLLQQWQLEAARQHYQQALQRAPLTALPYLRLGTLYFKKRQYQQALEYLQKALAIAPANLNAQINRAIIHLFQRHYKLAASELEVLHQQHAQDRFIQKFYQLARKAAQGPQWQKTYTYTSKHYHIRTNISRAFASLAAKHLESIYQGYRQLFHTTSQYRHSSYQVLLFKSRQGFIEYARGITNSDDFTQVAGGLFHAELGQLLLWQSPHFYEVLYHEAFHQFLDGFAGNFPIWFNEGLAQYFENTRLRGHRLQIGRKPPKKFSLIRKLIRQNRIIPLAKLRALKGRQFRQQAALAYPLSWSWIYFLLHYRAGQYRPLLNRFFKAFMRHHHADRAWQEAFAKVSEAKLYTQWRSYFLNSG